MLSFFRRVSKSKFGTWVMAVILIAILAGFAIADISNFGSGNIGFGMGSSTLAEVGDQKITEREMSDTMQRRLQQVRQQNPEADYAGILGEFDQMLGALIDERALLGFANKYGFHLSKRLIDAEITQIPQTRGLNGKFSQQNYLQFLAQARLTDTEVRTIIAQGLLERLLLGPAVANPRIAVDMAKPYASMLLEARQGEVATVPVDLFKAGLNPTDADLQRYYAANRNRYMVPEQRVIRIAKIGPDQVANVNASDQEVAAYYNQNQAAYAARETRTLSQAVAQDQRTAAAIAAKAKAGATLQAAALGTSAAVSSIGAQTRQAYSGIAGAKAAADVFAAPSGAVVGPVQTQFGWAVVKIESVKTEGGKSLDQARSEIAAKLTADKRKQAVEDLVTQVQNSVDDGSNFAEAVAQAKLAVVSTPLVMANGTSRTDSSYRSPAELAPALQAGFEIAPNDPPEIVTLPEDKGYALVAPAQVAPAAPAPLATIRDRVANDWVTGQALQRARAVATAIEAKASRGIPIDQAVKQAGAPLPAIRQVGARRINIATAQGVIPPALQALFTLGQGKSKLVGDPQGRAFFIVKVTRIVPGNALLQPGLIAQMQNELRDAATQDYATQFMAAVRKDMKVRRNEAAIAAEKQRLASTAG
jgi:peptidyl-prolyl cis-trans isomerase D